MFQQNGSGLSYPDLWGKDFTLKEKKGILLHIVNREMEKPEIEMDIGLIAYCDELLWSLHAEKTIYLPSQKIKNITAILRRLRLVK